MIKVFKFSDPLIPLVVIALLGFGLLGVLSAGMNLRSDPYFFFYRQLMFIGAGVVAFLIGAAINYHMYRFRTQVPYLVTIFLLILVFIFGKQSWLDIGFGFHLQPSEIAKLVIIAYLAYVLSFDRYGHFRFWKDSFPIMLTCVLLIIPTAIQPDFGTALVMTLITGFMLIMGGIPMKHLIFPTAIGLPFAAIVPFIFPHVMKRITNFFVVLNPFLSIDSLSYHDMHLRAAMGSGGLTGRGFCNGLVKRSFLPASHTDSMFAVLTEEGGWITGLIIILLFYTLFVMGERTARFASDHFGAMLARGITFYITGQAFLNIAVCLGLFPNTGVTLPLLSYGGSSMIVTLFAIGVLMNVSSQRQMIL